jgi:hypothetical protein
LDTATGGHLDAPRRAAAVAVAAVGLLVGALVGLLVAAIAVGLLLGVLTGPGATLVTYVGLAAGLILAATWLTVRWLPRLLHGDARLGAPTATRVPLTIGAFVAAATWELGVRGLDDLGWGSLVRVVGVLAAAAVGLALGERRRRRVPPRPPRYARGGGSLRAEDGAIAADQIAVLVIVAAVIAALLAIPLAPTIGEWGRYAVCTLFSSRTDCDPPGTELASNEPAYACVVSESGRGLNVNASFVIDVDRNLEYTTTVHSDGVVHLTYSNDAAGGAGVGGGLQADLYWGEGQLTLGAQASAGAAARFIEGEVFEWTGPDAQRWADRYRIVHGVSSAPADAVLGGRDGLLGRAYGGIVRGGNALLNAAPVVDGVEYRGPERTLIHTRGGMELGASGTFGRGPSPQQGVEGGIEASFERAVGTTTDTWTGERTVHLIVAESVSASGGAGDAEFVASWGNESVVAVRLGPDLRPLEANVTTYRLDEAGNDLTSTAGSRTAAFPDRRFADGSTSGGLTAPSLYVVETRLDLTDPAQREVLDRVVVGGALQLGGGVAGSYAGEHVLGPVHERGSTTITEYDVSDRRYGGDVEASAIGKAGGGASLLASDRRAVRSYYYDEDFDAYVPRTSCVS